MKVKVFTLPWRPDGEGFDDAGVQVFLDGRRVIDVAEHFFIHEKTPVLVLVVTYRDDGRAPTSQGRSSGREATPDAAIDLDPEERRRFEAVRGWRNQFARKSGRPPYTVLTNRQAAEICRRNPATRPQLGEIAGIGDSRIEEFGDELLALLRKITPGKTGSAADETNA